MARKIIMTGNNAVYIESRTTSVTDDGREIRMEGDGARYEERTATIAPHFPLNENVEQGMRVYQALKDKGFIASDTCEQSWLYVMGYSAIQPTEVRTVEWLKNVQLAREMLEIRHATMIENGLLKKCEMERLASLCFVRGGEPLKLAKPKSLLSSDSDELKSIFRP